MNETKTGRSTPQGQAPPRAALLTPQDTVTSKTMRSADGPAAGRQPTRRTHRDCVAEAKPKPRRAPRRLKAKPVRRIQVKGESQTRNPSVTPTLRDANRDTALHIEPRRRLLPSVRCALCLGANSSAPAARCACRRLLPAPFIPCFAAAALTLPAWVCATAHPPPPCARPAWPPVGSRFRRYRAPGENRSREVWGGRFRRTLQRPESRRSHSPGRVARAIAQRRGTVPGRAGLPAARFACPVAAGFTGARIRARRDRPPRSGPCAPSSPSSRSYTRVILRFLPTG